MAVRTQQDHVVDVGFASFRRRPRKHVVRLAPAVVGTAPYAGFVSNHQGKPLPGCGSAFGSALPQHLAGARDDLARHVADAPVIRGEAFGHDSRADELGCPLFEHFGVVGEVFDVGSEDHDRALGATSRRGRAGGRPVVLIR